MLVLTRKVDESITIGDSIVLTVLGIEGERVKIGINAPRDMLILRQEVFLAVQEQSKLQEMLANDAEVKKFEQLRKLLASDTDKETNEPDNDKDASQ